MRKTFVKGMLCACALIPSTLTAQNAAEVKTTSYDGPAIVMKPHTLDALCLGKLKGQEKQSYQGMDVWNDYIFSFQNTGYLSVYTTDGKTLKQVVKPLTGRKNGAYYGCLLLRPSNVMAFDDPENPTILEDFIKAIGAEPVVYPYRNECCGGYISIKDQEKAAGLCKKITDSADGFEADCLVTACPLCKYNLSKNSNLPIVYFTELLAEALGIKEAQA